MLFNEVEWLDVLQRNAVAWRTLWKVNVELDTEQRSVYLGSFHRMRFFYRDRIVYSLRALSLDRIVAIVYCHHGFIVNVRLTWRAVTSVDLRQGDVVTFVQASFWRSTYVCRALLSDTELFIKDVRIDFCLYGRCTFVLGKKRGSHKFALVVEIMLVWRRCAPHVVVTSLSKNFSRNFPYSPFPSLKSSRTPCSRAVGHTIWYTVVFFSLLSSRTTRRVCVVDDIQAVQSIFGLEV